MEEWKHNINEINKITTIDVIWHCDILIMTCFCNVDLNMELKH